MMKFKGRCFSLNNPDEIFYIKEEKEKNSSTLLLQIFYEVSNYAAKYNLEFPYEGYFNDILYDEKKDCIFVGVDLIESNLFIDNNDFQIAWDNLLKAMSRGTF